MDILFEKAKEIEEFDDDITRKELIKVLIGDPYSISYVFEYLTEQEKREYYPYTRISNIINYLKTFKFNEMLKVIDQKKDLFKDFGLYNICIDIVKEEELEIYLDKFHLQLKDYYINQIIKDISNDEMKKKFIDKYLHSEYYIYDAISTLSDKYKDEYLIKTEKTSNQVKIILSYNDKKKIEEYAYLSKYSDYRSDLVAGTENREFIIEAFNKIKVNKFRVNLINKVKNEELKLELISLLDENIKMWFFSNTEEIPKTLKELNGTELDSEITFGVELECSNKQISNYKNVSKIFNDYKVTRDSSVNNGLEIVSPILKYNIEDLNKLKNVCELLENSGFYTDGSAGGHIHIGASYFDKKEDFYMLLYLYINTEDILYFISDRKNSIKRKSIDRYASKNKQTYMEAIDKGMFEKNYEEIEDLFNEINENRYKGLNFKNLNSFNKNTIEFRMPNGEINFEEVLLNIKLFARLVEMSHKLNGLDKENDIKIMAIKIGKCDKEIGRLELLLSILFDNEEEKQKYRERYFANKRLYLLKLKNLINEFKTNLKTTELVEIEENSHLVRSKH